MSTERNVGWGNWMNWRDRDVREGRSNGESTKDRQAREDGDDEPTQNTYCNPEDGTTTNISR